MTTLLLLRRDLAAARQLQASIETTRDMRVAAIVSSLREAHAHIERCRPDVLLTDLSLEDGAAIRLLKDLRARPTYQHRPKVMLVTPSANDGLLFGSISAGGDSFVLDESAAASLPASLRAMLRGEAPMTASLAREVLSFFGTTARANGSINEKTLDWRHGAEDPLHLSRGEQHLLALIGDGEPLSGIAVRFALSIESIGRRLSNIYRKLQWDLRDGRLALHSA